MPGKAIAQDSSVHPTDSTSDNDKPLMTVEEIFAVIKAKRQPQRHELPLIQFPSAGNPAGMSETEVVRHLSNLSSSVLTAVKDSNNILKHAKNRRLISSKSSPEGMWWFRHAAEAILAEVASKCPRAAKHHRAELPGISVVQCMPRDELAKLTTRMQDIGCKALAATQAILTHKDHKVDFIANCLVGDMEHLRYDCWNLLGTIENFQPASEDKRQRRW
jgi:hypothetical protein